MQLDTRRCGLMCAVRSLVFGLFALLSFVAVGSAAAEPYSVEDVIRHQQASFVRFTADGAGVVIQHASSEAEYGWTSQLFWADPRDGGSGRALFDQAPQEGYASFSLSPDSRYAAYVHYHGDSENAAVYDFQSRRSTEFDLVPNQTFHFTWISDHEVMFSTVSPGGTRSSFTGQMSLQWRKMQEGRSTTASATGSGHYAARPENPGGEGIVIADLGTGAIRTIAPGRFLDQAASPSGTWLAAIRRVPSILNPQLPIVAGDERGPLVVFDIHRDGAERAIGDSSNVVPGSLLWSPSGRRLAFLTVGDSGPADQAQLWTYDTVKGTAHRVELGALSVSPSNSQLWGGPWQRTTAFAWLGEELTVSAQAPAVPSHATHTNWFLLRSGVAPINLTGQFNQAPEIVGITRDSLLMSADGQVWEVRANQKRRLLAADLGRRVRVIHDPRTFLDTINLPTSGLVLEDESSQGPKNVYFLDVASGRITGRVAAPAADAVIKSISPPAKRVAFSYRQNNVDVIAVADASGASRDILRLNEFQKDRQIGTFEKIDHMGSTTGQKLTSWLLLPPGYRNGPPLPTVVHIYPGTTYGLTPPIEAYYRDRALLLAAHGYAVLLVSLPVDRSVLPRDPLQGLADAVLLAVDAAIARGYVDGNRLAIQGHSFGGYGTLGVIGQTDRFKAAVAVAGVVDLLSSYGQPHISERLTDEFDGILSPDAPMGWAETGQGGMGVLPWRDPQRYLRNSPLLHVDTIHTPVMLVHGDMDAAVPITQSEEMFTALYRLNKDAVFVRYWGETHSVPSSPANIRDYWARVYAWYDTHIGPPFDVAKALSR